MEGLKGPRSLTDCGGGLCSDQFLRGTRRVPAQKATHGRAQERLQYVRPLQFSVARAAIDGRTVVHCPTPETLDNHPAVSSE